MAKKDETPEQLQRIAGLIEYIGGGTLDAWAKSLELWLVGKYHRGATVGWRQSTRHQQAAQYIEWLESEKDI